MLSPIRVRITERMLSLSFPYFRTRIGNAAASNTFRDLGVSRKRDPYRQTSTCQTGSTILIKDWVRITNDLQKVSRNVRAGLSAPFFKHHIKKCDKTSAKVACPDCLFVSIASGGSV